MSAKIAFEVGKRLFESNKFNSFINPRTQELIDKGYTAQVALTMSTIELGTAAITLLRSQGIIFEISANTGGAAGFEIGLVFEGVGAIPGGIIGTVIADLTINYAAFKLYLEAAGIITEGLFDPSTNSDEMLNQELPTLPTFSNLEVPLPGANDLPRWQQSFDDAWRANAYPVDPLMFDLDGDGKVSLTSLENGSYFDIDNDGFAQKISWISQGDGVLCLDRNGNGVIDNGFELFGENTLMSNGQYAKSGIEALADLDTHRNGIIDAYDSAFSKLKFLKADGTLVSLADAGIKQINLTYSDTNETDEFGNIKVKSASFVKNDGTVLEYGEFLLNQNHTNSIPTDCVEVSSDIAELPELMFSGKVHTLQQTMMGDATGGLKALVEGFIAEGDTNVKYQMVEDILFAWAGTQNVATTGRGLFDAQKLATLEKFMGRYLGSNPNSTVTSNVASDSLNQSWGDLVNSMYSQLAVQTHLSDVFSEIEYSFDVAGGLSFGYEGIFAYLQNLIDADTSVDKADTKDFVKDFSLVLSGLKYTGIDGYIYLMEQFETTYADYFDAFLTGCSALVGTSGVDDIRGTHKDTVFYGGSGNDTMSSGSGDDVLYGGADNDVLYGHNGNDVLYGGAGSDNLYGGLGDDVLYAGAGNDWLRGENGSDTYIIDPALINGASYTIIRDNALPSVSGYETDIDKIVFKGVSSNDVKIWADSDGYIYVTFNNYPDSKVEIDRQTNLSNKIELFQFEDCLLTFDEFVERYLRTAVGTDGNDRIDASPWTATMHGGAGNDSMLGSERNDIIYGDAGNDSLYSGGGDDILYGGDGDDYISGGNDNDILYGDSGNDRLYGDAGDDVLDGGEGNDQLYGGAGDDVLYGSNGGDSLYGPAGDKLYGDAGSDTYIIDPSFITVQSVTTINDYKGYGNNNEDVNKVVFVGVNSDEITVQADSQGHITIKFNSNPLYSVVIEYQNTDMYKIQEFVFKDKTISLGEFVDEHLRIQQGTEAGETISVSPFANEVFANGGNDYIYGNIKDDIIHGGEGNDYISGSWGDDILYGGAGDDRLYGDAGNDVLDGGEGNDQLQGGAGDDIYIFRAGSGIDSVGESGGSANEPGGNDTIRLLGISKENVAMYMDHNGNLVIKYGNNDQITVNNQLWPRGQVERFELDNNLYMTNIDINNLIQDINAYAANNNIQITDVNAVRNNQDLMQLVAGAWHS